MSDFEGQMSSIERPSNAAPCTSTTRSGSVQDWLNNTPTKMSDPSSLKSVLKSSKTGLNAIGGMDGNMSDDDSDTEAHVGGDESGEEDIAGADGDGDEESDGTDADVASLATSASSGTRQEWEEEKATKKKDARERKEITRQSERIKKLEKEEAKRFREERARQRKEKESEEEDKEDNGEEEEEEEDRDGERMEVDENRRGKGVERRTQKRLPAQQSERSRFGEIDAEIYDLLYKRPELAPWAKYSLIKTQAEKGIKAAENGVASGQPPPSDDGDDAGDKPADDDAASSQSSGSAAPKGNKSKTARKGPSKTGRPSARKGSARKGPAAKGPAGKGPPRKAPARKAPATEAPTTEAPTDEASASEAPVRRTSSRKGPPREASRAAKGLPAADTTNAIDATTTADDDATAAAAATAPSSTTPAAPAKTGTGKAQFPWQQEELDYASTRLREIVESEGVRSEHRFQLLADSLNQHLATQQLNWFGQQNVRTKIMCKNIAARRLRQMWADQGIDFQDRKAPKNGGTRSVITSARDNKKRPRDVKPVDEVKGEEAGGAEDGDVHESIEPDDNDDEPATKRARKSVKETVVAQKPKSAARSKAAASARARRPKPASTAVTKSAPVNKKRSHEETDSELEDGEIRESPVQEPKAKRSKSSQKPEAESAAKPAASRGATKKPAATKSVAPESVVPPPERTPTPDSSNAGSDADSSSSPEKDPNRPSGVTLFGDRTRAPFRKGPPGAYKSRKTRGKGRKR